MMPQTRTRGSLTIATLVAIAMLTACESAETPTTIEFEGALVAASIGPQDDSAGQDDGSVAAVTAKAETDGPYDGPDDSPDGPDDSGIDGPDDGPDDGPGDGPDDSGLDGLDDNPA